jgi:glyoxalase family protein
MATEPNKAIRRHHHITLCTGGAQEDYDFHTGVLGLKSVKKTALYDGTVPIYHLYYGNDHGDESTLVTSFPMRQSGRKGRPGSGQIHTLSLSIPEGSAGDWKTRLTEHGFDVTETERFGEKVLAFKHPCGLDYELVEVADDSRSPHTAGPVSPDMGIRGTHGITLSIRDLDTEREFLDLGWNATHTKSDGDYYRYEVGAGGTGTIVDVKHDPEIPQGTWTFGEGTVHHCAFQVDDLDIQTAVKGYLEGLGFTDVSDRKDRGYFLSVYVRTPGGPLFEATVSKAEGFEIDEPYESIGREFQVPPVFADQREWIMGYLEPLAY